MRQPLRVLTLAVLLLASVSVHTADPPVRAAEKPDNACEPANVAALIQDSKDQDDQKPVPADPAPVLQPVNPSLLFSDDFEATGSLARWRGSGTLAVTKGDSVSGAYAARGTGTLTDTGTFARQTISGGQNTINYQVNFKVVSQGSNPLGLTALRGINDRRLFTMTLGSNGALGYTNDLSGVRAISNVVPTPGTWYQLQSSLTVNMQTKQVVILVWLNHQPVYGLWRTEAITPGDYLDLMDVRSAGKGVIGIVQLGDSSGGRVYDVLFDDVIVSNQYIDSSVKPADVPGSVTIQTSPAVEGALFQVEGRSFATDRDGKVTLDVKRMTYNLRDRITIAAQPLAGGEFAGAYPRVTRWFNWNSGEPDSIPTAALGLWYPVTWSFHNLNKDPVKPDVVTSLTFKSSVGERFTFQSDQNGEVQMFQGRRVVPTPQGLTSKEIYYTLESACVAGSSVVHRAQQSYFPDQKQAWPIELLFYSAHVSSKDAFFGYSIGNHINLTYPDGTVRQVPLESDGTADIPTLPRGDYEMSVAGPGYSPARPVTVTRNQKVELEMVSYVDMASAVLFLGLAALGLLLVGRPNLYRVPKAWIRGGFRRRGDPPASPGAGP
jgi:hypothetical protein